MEEIIPEVSGIRRSGSAALDLAWVAAGRYDGYFQNNLNLWDVAAGKIIIEEAGGEVNKISDFKINDIYFREGNTNIYDKMITKLYILHKTALKNYILPTHST